MNPTLKLAVLKTIKESFDEKTFMQDITDAQDEINNEWWGGQNHQSWKLVSARDLIIVWNTYVKYGRIDEKKLGKIWDTVKNCVLKILINSDITNGSDPDFFNKEDYDEITAEDWKRWAMFISDRSNSPVGRGSIDWSGPGMGRYTDVGKHLYNLLEKGYRANTDEELLIAVDQILNFVHGSGAMAKWFVEGGTMTLNKLRDMDVKGIIIPGKLTENTRRFLKESLGILGTYINESADFIGSVNHDVVNGEAVYSCYQTIHGDRQYHGNGWRYDSRKNRVLWSDEPSHEDKSLVVQWLVKRNVDSPNHITYSQLGRMNEFNVENLPRRFKDKGGYSVSEHPLATDFQVGKYYEDGDVLNYIHGQHGEFADDDRVSGVFQCIEVDPKTIPESEWHVEPEKVSQMVNEPRDIPPIVVDKRNGIIDGGHRLASAIQRGLPKIKVLKQV